MDRCAEPTDRSLTRDSRVSPATGSWSMKVLPEKSRSSAAGRSFSMTILSEKDTMTRLSSGISLDSALR